MDIPKVDVSKAPHPSIVNAILFFVPGLFLEMLFFLFNPAPFSALDRSLLVPSGLRVYFWILIAIFNAFLLAGLAEAWTKAIAMFLGGSLFEARTNQKANDDLISEEVTFRSLSWDSAEHSELAHETGKR